MIKKAVFFIMSLVLLSSAVMDGGFCSAAGTNIALHKKYTIESGAANEYSYGPTEVGSKDQLTDGKTGDPKQCYSGDWSHFVRAVSRTITLDLEKVMSVNGFEIGFLQNKSAGIYCPQEVVFSISENGNDFMTVARVPNNVPNTETTPTRVVYNASAGKNYKARYIRIYFDVQVNSFADEIQVFGSENLKNAATITPDAPAEESKYFDSGKDIGVKDIICFHYGYWPDDETLANNKKDVFKPYIGYIDTNGNYVDTMFDAVMFLIIQGKCPSGGSLTANGGPSIMSDWQYLISNTFEKNINLDALDQATAELKEVLKLPDSHKTAVYLSVPHPKISDIEFGDYDGDGKVNKITSLEDCVKVYTWYVDEVLRIYKQKNYQHIELKGFFWSNESLLAEYYEEEPELAKRCVAELHKRNMQCIFIPYYQATGIEKAKEVGFDATIMQANLTFNQALQKNPEKMMEDFKYTAEKYHTGIQMEMHDSFVYNYNAYAPLYKQYLISASNNGLMKDAIHAYYQGAGYGAMYRCAVSKDPKIRWFYDATYKFIKGTLNLPEFKVDITTDGTTTKGKTFVGKFDIVGDWCNGQYEFSIAQQPKHGTLAINPDNGEYIYRPDRKYVGTDRFKLKYNNIDGKPVLVEVNMKITTENGELSEASSESSSNPASSTSSPEEPSSSNNGWLYGLITGVAGTAVIAAALYFIFRKKKK